jgi:ubiquinone/menaquinone biosynthesis C-methylase UbiE
MSEIALVQPELAKRSSSVDWNDYARCYDLLCALNPAYTELIQEFRSFVENVELQPGARILDLGGGTGNFFCDALPREMGRSCELMHLDADAGMLGIAEAKYEARGLNVTTIHRDASKSVFPVASLDCILSVNALYAMPHPEAILRRAYHWLRPGGSLFLVDLGRIQDTTEWTKFLVKSNANTLGVFRTLRVLLKEGRVISRANRRIAEAQRAGVYWQHSAEQLRTILEQIGFELDTVRTVYRGYSDLAFGRKPA